MGKKSTAFFAKNCEHLLHGSRILSVSSEYRIVAIRRKPPTLFSYNWRF